MNATPPSALTAPWWRHAVTYQVYVRSFADGDGDGVGDLAGITARLPYLRDLGADAVWLTPFYPSPQRDHGYDVADYTAVDPLFGSLDDADALLMRAHDLGLRVIVDLVPNHTSSEHPWFQAALRDEPGARSRYLFRPGRDGGPPNNWRSVFGGPAWTQVEDGSWYLHLFDSSQPDLDWRHPEVRSMFEDVLRFWLDRGVDGFRVDVAHGLVKEASLRDQVRSARAGGGPMVERAATDEPMWDQPEVHEIYRSWRRILESYDGDRMLVAEAWTQTPQSLAAYVRADEMHQAFNFAWLLAPWDATAFHEVIGGTLAALEEVAASPTWVLSNHDVDRHASRYGGGQVGLARARAATVAMLALPGSAYLYQGEELGLEQVPVAPSERQDPAWLRTRDSADPQAGRDGCRIPMPWEGSAPPYGFGPGSGQPWLPQPADWAPLTVAAQTGAEGSTLELYRAALAARRVHALDAGDRVDLLPVDDGVLAFTRGPLTVVLNAGPDATELPAGEVVLASGELDDPRLLPPDTAVWLRCATGSGATRRASRCASIGDMSGRSVRDDQHGPVELRPLEESDVEVLATWAVDPELCAAAEWTAGMTSDEARRRMRNLVLSPPAELLRLGALLDGRLVGYVDLAGKGTRRELGFLVGEPSQWGRGIGRLVATAGVRFGFARLGLTAIWAAALDANERSIRILQALGMTELGPGDRHTYRGRPTFYRRFELLAAASRDDA